MYLRKAFMLSWLLLAAGSLFGQNLGVSYLEGEASAARGGATVRLSVGKEVSPEATIVLGQGACIVLKAAGKDIVLSQKGSYSLPSILSSRRSASLTTALRALALALSRIAGRQAKNQGTVVGTRGALTDEGEGDEWAEGGASVFLDAGRQLIASAQYEKAIEQLKRALNAAEEGEIPEVRYNLANAHALAGDTLAALSDSAGLSLSGGEPWAADFILFKGKLLMDTFAYEQAVQWLEEKGGALARDTLYAPTYLFLLGLAHRGTGNMPKGNKSLSQVAEITPGSDLAKAALGLIRNP